MLVSATPIPRFASGVPSRDIGFPLFVGRSMDIGTRVGTPIHHRYGPMFSTCSKTRSVALMNVRGDSTIVKRLLTAGADPQQKNAYGRSPRDIATSLGEATV